MRKSIRWTLLLWYGLIVAMVVGLFGGVLYFQVRRTLLASVEAELESHARSIAGAMQEESDGRFDIALPEAQVRFFIGPSYGAVWNREGGWIDRTDPSREIPRPMEAGVRQRGAYREVIVAGPNGSLVLTGKPIHAELARLSDLLRIIALIGSGVLALAMAAGWLLANRVLDPVRRISQAAGAISETDLARRVDLRSTEDELGQLAAALNRTFDRLEAAFHRQAQFTGDASHELRTPLSILAAQIEVALKKDRPAAEYRQTMETCLKAVRRMTALVEGMLVLARLDSSPDAFERKELDLKIIIDDAVTQLRPLALERGVSLDVDARPAPVMGDRDRLSHVAQNLVANAIRYNREGGRVSVRLHDGVLEVEDTGIGIPEEDRPHIFERFYRVDKARSRDRGGVGLGLAISKRFIDAHGGSITFESREGEGTTFRVALPKRPA